MRRFTPAVLSLIAASIMTGQAQAQTFFAGKTLTSP